MKLLVVTASVRENRVGGIVGNWITEFATQHGGFDEVQSVDLRELNLPVFNEPNHPVMQDYKYDHTKKWSAIVDSADALVFVTPEYNYFAPGSLVNAIDYLTREWAYKPAGLVSYGGASGGMRSAQSIKPLLNTVKVVPMSEGVSFHMVNNYIDGEQVQADKMHDESASAMLDEMVRWTKALSSLR